jgi:hypothetical protein
LPAREFQVLRGIGHKRLYHTGGDSRIQFGCRPGTIAAARLVVAERAKTEHRASPRDRLAPARKIIGALAQFVAFALDKAR